MSRYQPRHAKPSRLPARTAVLLVGASTALSIPALAQPAAAHNVSYGSSSSVAGETVRYGSRGAAVAEVQRRLGISSDGVFGPQTQSAVLGFQRARGLVADGIVGPRTWAALGSSTQRASRSGARSSAYSSIGAAAVAEAARHQGKPYVYGADGPSSFDCSGFTQYVFARLGVSLPHNAAAQYSSVRHVSQSDRRLGDLIFMTSGGRVSHVGIYAGDNTFWVARRTGTTVTRQTIWTSNYLVGRAA